MTRNYQAREERHLEKKLKGEERNNMRKEDIIRIFADATDEQVKGLLDINSADITHALEKRKGELDTATTALEKANETIRTLEAKQGDMNAMQAEIDRYKAEEAQRKAAEQQAAEQAALEQRFNAVTGDRKFIHEFVRAGVMADFGKALKDHSNIGKSDADVFAALVRDQNYFANQNTVQVNMAAMGNPRSTEVKDMAGLLKLSFADQMKFKAEHPSEFAQIIKQNN